MWHFNAFQRLCEPVQYARNDPPGHSVHSPIHLTTFSSAASQPTPSKQSHSESLHAASWVLLQCQGLNTSLFSLSLSFWFKNFLNLVHHTQLQPQSHSTAIIPMILSCLKKKTGRRLGLQVWFFVYASPDTECVPSGPVQWFHWLITCL